MRCAALLMLAVLGTSRSTSAGEQSTLIVLVPPPLGEASTREVINRVRGELTADGFSVLLVEPVPRTNRAAVLARAAHEAGGDPVTIGLFVDPNATTIELWLVDRITGKMLERRVETPPGSPDQKPEVLARHTVDVLRASLLDLLVTGLRTAVSEAQAKRPPAPAAVESSETFRVGLQGGLGVLASFAGLDPAILPVVRASVSANETFELRATGAWLGTRPSVRAASGTAAVDQGVALLEGVARLSWERWPVRPLLSLGAGTYYAGVDGSAAPPQFGLRTTRFAFAMDAGVGAAVLLSPHFELIVEAHALITEPGIAVRFVTFDAAMVGRPSVLGTLTLAGWI